MSELKALDELREWSHHYDHQWLLDSGEYVEVYTTENVPGAPAGSTKNIGEAFMELADRIEAEITERYIELPDGWAAEQAREVINLWPTWDDGSPCMFGDEFTYWPKYMLDEKYETLDRLVIYPLNHVWHRGEENETPHTGGYYEWNYFRPGGDDAAAYRPTKKRKHHTVEDVLADLINDVALQGHQIGIAANEIIAKYAAELQMKEEL